MKKTHSRFVLAVLVALLVAATCISVFSVSASAETKNGITAMLSTDKVSYAESDPVKVTLNVTNQSGKQAVVTTTVTAPEGWIGVSGQAVNTMTLESGDTNTGELVLQAKKMGGIGPLVLILIIVLVIILALLVVFLVVKKKKGRLAISVFLCVILAGVLVLSTVPAQAAGAADTLTVSKTVTVGDESVTITATVEFTLNNEVVDDGVYTRQELEDALMATAWAYYMKGSKMQYCSEEITLGLNKYTGGNYRLTEDAAPEFGTADSTIYSVCSDFVYKMYYEALGHRMFGAENYLGATTSDFWLKSASVELVRWFHPSYELKEIDTKYGVTKDKAMTTDEVISFLGGWKQNLRPGDVLVVTGHAMVYVGNGYILDCWGSKYDMALGLEQKEYSGAVHVLHKIEDMLIQGDDPVSGSEYKISDDSTKDYLVIFRPLDAFVSEKSSADTGNDIIDLAAMSEDTSKYTSAISRIEYPGMEIDRTVDAGPYGAVATGNVLTYNVKVSNLSDDANYILYRRGQVKGYAGEGYTDLVITETVPEGTELVEGSITGGGVCKDGVITWTVDIEAGSSVEVSYAVKVTAKRGESIVNDGGKVDEIASNKLVSTVSGSGLSDIALKGLSGLAATEKTSWRETYNISKLGTDLEFAERVYQSAMGIGLELPTAQEVLDNLFTYQTVENESCSDRYPNSMRANLYVLNEEVEGQWQVLADMLVEGYYGGRKLYSEDRNLTINEFKASYLQPGDILVYASTADADGSVTASRVMVYAGKNSDGNAVLLSLISDQISRVFVGSTNNNADELHTILWKALTEDVFFVLRPTQAYDDINTLTYEKANEPTYGDEPAERKEGLQIGPDYSTELSEEYVFNLAGLNAAGWKNYNTAFIEEVYQAIGLDISSGTKGTTIKNMLNGNIFFHSVGTSTNRNYELQAVASAEMERLSSMMVPGLRGGPDMVGYTDNLISLKDLQPGDTINMVQLQRGIIWVGVYLGDGKVLVSQYASNAPSGKYQTYQVYDFGTDTDGSAFAEFLTKDDIDGVKWNCYFVTRPSWGFEDINDNPYDGNSSISYVSGLKGFEQVQSMDDIEDGYYVIVVKYNSKYYFMTNEADESRVQFSAATADVSGSAITAGNLQYWCIDVNTRRSSGYDVYISNADGYLYQKAQDTASLDVTNSTGTDGASWCLRSDGAGHFTLTNSGTGARMLMLSTQHSSFKAYSAGSDSRYPELLLFKYTGSGSSAKAVLADGKYNVIVKVGSKYYAMTDVYNEELCCLNAVEVTLTNGVFTGEDMTAWTVTNAGAGDSHTFVSPDGQYLTRNAWSANMKLSDSAVTWTVTKSGSNYTIFNSVEDDALRYLAYNGTGFKAYEAAREDRIIEMMIVPAAESSGSEPTKPVVADGEYNVIVKIGSKYYAMTDVYNEELGCMSAVEVTLVDGIFTGANMSAWTVSNAGAKNSFTFMTSDGKYLSRNTWSANMKLGDSATAWTVTKSGSNCTISNSVEDDALRYLAYNGTGFKAYEAAQEDRIIELLLVPVGGTVPDDSTGDNSGDEGGDTPVTPEPVEPVIVDGNYNVVIKYGDVYYAMTSTFDETNGCLAAVEVTLTDGTVTSGNPTDWIITNDDNGNVTLMAPDGKYLIRSNGSSNIDVGTAAENWMLVKNEIGGTYTLQNTNTDSRYLAYNGTGFKAYKAAQEDRIIELLLVPVGGTVPDDSTGDNSGDEGGDTPVTPEPVEPVIVDGNYNVVIKYGDVYYAMTSTFDETNGCLAAVEVTLTDGTVTSGNPTDWIITNDDNGNVTLMAPDGQYLIRSNGSSNIDVGTAAENWMLVKNEIGGTYTLQNTNTDSRYLAYNGTGFKAYKAAQEDRIIELLLVPVGGTVPDDSTGDNSGDEGGDTPVTPEPVEPVIVDGNYNVVIKYGDVYYAMTSTFDETNGCLAAVEVTLTDGTVTSGNPTDWIITNDDNGNVTLMAPDGKYLIRSNGSSNIDVGTAAENWMLVKNEIGGTYTLQNTNTDSRYLAYNGTGFKAYKAAQEDRIIELLLVPVGGTVPDDSTGDNSGDEGGDTPVTPEPVEPVIVDGNYNVVIKYGDVYYAMTSTFDETNGCLAAVEVTLTDGTVTSGNPTDWIITNDDNGNVTLMAPDGKYLIRSNGSSNIDVGTAAENWMLVKNEIGGTYTLQNTNTDSRYLAYNGTGFKAYKAAQEDRIIELLLVPVGGTVPDDSTGDNSGDEGGDTPVTPEPVEPVIVDGNYNVVIKYGDVYYAMTSTFDETNGCLAAVEVTLTDGTVTSGNPTDWIITNDDNGNVTLMAPDGQYLIRSNGSSNIDVGTAAENWMLVKNEIGGTYTLQNTNTDSRYLAYNGTGFKAYKAAQEDRIIELLLVPVGGTVPDDSTGDNSGDEGGDTPVTPENLSDISGNYVISYYDADAGKYKVMSSTVAGDVVAFVEATSLQTSDLPVWTIRMTASSQTDRTVTLQNDKGEYLAHSGASMYVQATSFCWTVTEDDNGNYRFFHNDGSLTRYLMFTSANSGFKAYTDNTDDRKDPLTVQKVSDLGDIQPTTYTQVISASDVTNGDYLVVVAYRGKYYLMTQTLNASATALTAIGCEVTDGTIVTYVEAFTFTKTENGFTLAAGEQYVNNSAGSANLALNDTQMVWTVSADGDVFNLTSNGRLLMYSEDNAGFKSYAADKDDAEGAKFTSQLLLFKK